MSGNLRFLSYLRVGLAASIRGPAAAPNAQAAYAVTVSGRTLQGQFRLFGPGDVRALEPSEVLRSFPTADARDHEPNLFAHVELKSADLPWRYAPGGPQADRLRPWLVLVVVEERPGVTLQPRAGGLPVLTTPSSELPDLTDAWAWAHVQLELTGTAADDDLQTLYRDQPQRFVARLVCPRKLQPRRSYLACVVPAYDVGRDAGLGLSVAGRTGLSDAWTAGDGVVTLPVYHAWSFGCSRRGDFEYLAEKLRPRVAPPDLGVAALDASAPGLGLPGVDAAVPMPGALCAPGALTRTAQPVTGEPALRNALWTVVQGGAVLPLAAQQDDPVLAPPLYGAAQAGVQPSASWQRALNQQPAARAAAGLGAEFVRTHQEELAATAWMQLEELARLQRTLRRDALKTVAGRRRRQRLEALARGEGDGWLVFARACCAQVELGAKDVLRQLREDTDVPAQVASAAAARIAVRAGRVRRRHAQAEPSATGMTRLCLLPDKRPDFAPQPGPGGRTRARTMQPVDTGALKAVALPVSAGGPALPPHPGAGRTPAPPAASGYKGGGGIGGAFWTASDPVSFLRSHRRRHLVVDTKLGIAADGALPSRLMPELSFGTPFGAELARQDPQYLVPNAGSLPADTIATLEVNTAFIEAFLAGMNGEWSSELVWREMPAAPRATSMRRFWDCDDEGDQIPAIAAWRRTAALGNSATALAGGDGLALVVKGRLLERYPDTQVYAVRAAWKAGRREPLAALGPKDIAWPDVHGQLGRGVHYLIFFGLGIEQANGADLARVDPNAPGNADPGWFFVLEERPGAPRFGLDLPESGKPVTPPTTWQELNWAQVATAGADDGARHVALTPPRGVREIDGLAWAAGAGEMAAITLQTPFRMYLHGSSMLGRLGAQTVKEGGP